MVRYCKKCVMPDTRPGIQFNDEGICYPCLNHERRKTIDWMQREQELKSLCNRYRRTDGKYDCIIPVSGGKDSHYQTYIMKEVHHMHPLLVNVADPFTQTRAGLHNIRNLSERFGCDLWSFSLNRSAMKKMVRLAFEHFGSPTWPIDMAIYSIPLKAAAQLRIPLIVYGENISYEYGGPGAVESPSARNQIQNRVVLPVEWQWWYDHGITPSEVQAIRYPEMNVITALDPIYLSYYYPWDGHDHYLQATEWGFWDLRGEWDREGYIENYDQIDSYGYLVHPWLKYPKFGHARTTDVASSWIRAGRITREDAIDLVRKHDHKLPPESMCDFQYFTGFTDREFVRIVNRYFNRDLFKCVGRKWVLKNPIWKT